MRPRRFYALLLISFIAASQISCSRATLSAGENPLSNWDGYGNHGSGFGNMNPSEGFGGSGAGPGQFNNLPLGNIDGSYNPNAPGAQTDPSKPAFILFDGPKQTYTFSCTKYQISLATMNGSIVPNDQDPLQVFLSDDGNAQQFNVGAFFADPQCKQGLGAATFATGQATLTAYYLSVTARTTVLKADGTYNGNPIIGRYRINVYNNPALLLPICFNYEDMYGCPGSDMDYNDVVVRGQGVLAGVGQGRMISYGVQQLALQVSGTAGYVDSTTIQVFDSNGRVKQSVTIPDQHAGATVQVNLSFGDEVKVTFRSPPQNCNTQPHTSGDPAVRVSNTCRNASQEGQAWQ